MTVNRGPGVAPIAGVGTTTVEHRLQLAGLYAENAPGVPRSGVLGQSTELLVVGRTDMSYDVGPAALVINRTANEGVYTPTLTGTTNVTTDAAPETNSRWDLIYVKQNDQAKGDADNQAVIGVQKGTAAASPTKPTGSLPAGAYVIGEARIFAGTTGTSEGSNTIAQVWRHTVARGAPIPVRDATELAEITPTKSKRVQRLDLSGSPVYTGDGAAWGAFASARVDGTPAASQPIVKAAFTSFTTGTFGDVTINLPAAFPNGLTSALVQEASTIGNNDYPVLIKVRMDQSDRTKLVLRCYRADDSKFANSSINVNYIAVGY